MRFGPSWLGWKEKGCCKLGYRLKNLVFEHQSHHWCDPADKNNHLIALSNAGQIPCRNLSILQQH
jgi:hypothetical protein